MTTHWLPALVALPIAGAVLAPTLPRRGAWSWGFAVLLATLGVALFLAGLLPDGALSYPMGGWPPPFGIELRFDVLSAFAVPVALVSALAVPFAARTGGPIATPEGIAVILLGTGGMMGFMVAGDFFTLFVFLEVLSLSAYAMVAMSEERGAGIAAFRYLLMGAVASIVILLSVGLLYTLTGSLNMADVGARLPDGGLPLHLATGGFVAGFLLKAAAFPLHVWLPDAHATAPSAVSAILSGLIVKMGVIGLLRTPGLEHLHELLLWVGAASLLAGALFALVQDDLKRMLAYSTVSNVGLIVLGLAVDRTGATVHILNHAVIKASLFLAAGAFIHRAGSRQIEGIGRGMPLTTTAFAVAGVAAIGIPPTGGFTGKWMITLGALEAGRPVVAAIVLLGAVLLGLCYARFLVVVAFRSGPAEEVAGGEAPPAMLLPILALAILTVGLGLVGGQLAAFVGP
ncbi:MAG: proton-conducting transporter membrane subunit [Gemmatimonadota bacterium]